MKQCWKKIIDFSVHDNVNIVKSMLKHQYRGLQGQVLKSYKRKIDELKPVLSFLAYPSNQVKVIPKHDFAIVKYGRAQQCGCTKSDDLWLKKNLGYMIKKNKDKILYELREASKVTLENVFKKCEHCSA